MTDLPDMSGMTPSEQRRARKDAGIKLPPGRKVVYQDDYPEQLIEMMSRGLLNCEVCAHWNISAQTFMKWRNQKEDLNEAYEIGHMKCEAFYSRLARENILNKEDKGFKFFIGIMNNKFGWEKGGKGDATTTNNITIGSMNVLQQKDRQGLLETISAFGDKHKEILDVEFTRQPEPGEET